MGKRETRPLRLTWRRWLRFIRVGPVRHTTSAPPAVLRYRYLLCFLCVSECEGGGGGECQPTLRNGHRHCAAAIWEEEEWWWWGELPGLRTQHIDHHLD